MIVPQFLRFYSGYTAQSALSEYARVFFTLVNSMFRLQAQEMLANITSTSVGFNSGKEAQSVISKLEKESKGLSGIVREVRVIKP